jgi:hypothetical protein
MAVMTAPLDTSLLATTAIGALIVWRLVARIRRAIGRQRLTTFRPWISVTLLPLVVCMILFGSLFNPTSAGGLLLGIVIGIALGRLGTRLTRFEVTPAGLFYTPNAHLGIALSVLLVVRLGYRFLRLHGTGEAFDPSSMELGRSPLTLALFGMLAGYYVTYAVGLLRWRAKVRAET